MVHIGVTRKLSLSFHFICDSLSGTGTGNVSQITKIITKALVTRFYPCATEESQLFSLLYPCQFEHKSRVLRDSEHKGGADSMLQLHYESVSSPHAAVRSFVLTKRARGTT